MSLVLDSVSIGDVDAGALLKKTGDTIRMIVGGCGGSGGGVFTLASFSEWLVYTNEAIMTTTAGCSILSAKVSAATLWIY